MAKASIIAIAWYAKQNGTTYGELSNKLTPQIENEIAKAFKKKQEEDKKKALLPKEKRLQEYKKHVFDPKKAEELFNQNYSDTAIARVIGVSEITVQKWRLRTGRYRQEPKTMIDREQLEELYSQGMSDGEIAKELGCTASGVASWRKRNEKPANLNRGGRPKNEAEKKEKGEPTKKKIQDDIAEQLYAQGMNDTQIAKYFGCCKTRVYKWRLKTGKTLSNYTKKENEKNAVH